MIYYIRCSLNGKKYWYYSGKERINGKIEPCFIDEREFKKTHRVQQFVKDELKNHLPRIKEQCWKVIEIVEIK